MTKMGLGPVSSLEVLDMSYNRLSGEVDAKALRHLIWLVELRVCFSLYLINKYLLNR